VVTILAAADCGVNRLRDRSDIIRNAVAGVGIEDARHLPATVEAGPMGLLWFCREISPQRQMNSAASTFKGCMIHGELLAKKVSSVCCLVIKQGAYRNRLHHTCR
jgi:hypothetical protein